MLWMLIRVVTTAVCNPSAVLSTYDTVLKRHINNPVNETLNLKPVQLLGGTSTDGFSAIKMTALGRPQFLVHTRIVKQMSFCQ